MAFSNSHDSLIAEIRELEKKNQRLEMEQRALARSNYELSVRNVELQKEIEHWKDRVSDLEATKEVEL